MAIRKDVNDMLNNLKREETPKKEEKHSKSKFDDMSVDDLLTALNDIKENKTERPVKKNAPIRELKRIPPSKPKEEPKPEKKDSQGKKENKKSSPKPKSNEDSKQKKKKIVISGELPDYEAIRQQEINEDRKKEENKKKEKPSEPKEKPSEPAESEKKDNNKNNKDNNSGKGLFGRIKDLMYVSAEDDKENEEEISEKSDDGDDDKGSFTVEEIKENTDITVASIEEAVSAIIDTELVKEESKVVSEKENKQEEKKSEPVSNNRKNNNKTKQNSNGKKKPESNNSKSETKTEKPKEKKSEVKTEKQEEKKSEAKTEKQEEKKPEAKAEKREEKKSENKTEKPVNSEEKKTPAKNTQQSDSKKKKKNGNNQKKDNQKPVKSSESIIENIQKDAENVIAEIENNKAPEEKKKENDDTSVEETKKVSDEKKKKTDKNQTTDKSNVKISGNKENVRNSEKFKKERYAIPALLCIVLAIIGVVAIISTLISNIGGGKDDFTEAVYPAVIMNIDSFSSPSELASDQIISAAIWSVVIDNKKLSGYKEVMGAVNIPAADVEKFAVELFGDDIPELNHTTVGSAETKFYYNQEAESYNVPIKPDTFTYLPEVTSVSKRDGEYRVDVNYIEEHPEWMDKSVAKTVQFRLSKNDDGGYKINSMTIISEGSST